MPTDPRPDPLAVAQERARVHEGILAYAATRDSFIEFDLAAVLSIVEDDPDGGKTRRLLRSAADTRRATNRPASDADIERWYAAFEKVSGMEASTFKGRCRIYWRFIAALSP